MKKPDSESSSTSNAEEGQTVQPQQEGSTQKPLPTDDFSFEPRRRKTGLEADGITPRRRKTGLEADGITPRRREESAEGQTVQPQQEGSTQKPLPTDGFKIIRRRGKTGLEPAPDAEEGQTVQPQQRFAKKPKLGELVHDTIKKMPFYGVPELEKFEWSEFADDLKRYVELQLLQAAYGKKLDFSQTLERSAEKVEEHLYAGAQSLLKDTPDNAKGSMTGITRQQIELVKKSDRLIEELVKSLDPISRNVVTQNW